MHDEFAFAAMMQGATSANKMHAEGGYALQVVAASPVLKGVEVHNTYGELGNAELVNKYGFALRNNPFSAVPLDKAAVLQAAQSVVGQRTMRLRSRFLRRERWGLLSHTCRSGLVAERCCNREFSRHCDRCANILRQDKWCLRSFVSMQ